MHQVRHMKSLASELGHLYSHDYLKISQESRGGMVEWHTSPTNVTRVRSPDPPSYEGRVCCLFFSGFSGFPLNLKTNTFKFQLDLKRASTFNPLLPQILHWTDTKNGVPIPFHPDFPETFSKW